MRARALALGSFLLAVGASACGRSGVLAEVPGGGDIPVPRVPGLLPGSPTPTGTPPTTNVEWVNVIGGGEDDRSHAVSMGSTGRVGCAGSFRATVELGEVDEFAFGEKPVIETSAGEEDVFIAVYETDGGAYVWHHAGGAMAADVGRAFAMHADGRVIAGGRYDSASMSLGGTGFGQSGGGDSFVVAYSAGGAFLWQAESAGNLRDEVHATEWAGGSAFSVGDADSSGTDVDSYADRRSESNGSIVGTVNNTTASANEFLRAAVAAPSGQGTWVGAGFFTGTGTYNGVSYTASGEDAIAWHCVIGVGCIDWALHVGGDLAQRATAVLWLPGGDYVVAGWFEGDATLDTRFEGTPVSTESLSAAGGSDAFVARIGLDGTILWAVRAGGTGNDRTAGIAVGEDGRIHVAGTYEGAFDPGGGLSLLPAASAGSFLLLLDLAGVPIAASSVGGDGVEVKGITVSGSGDAYLTGSFAGTVDFGRGPVTSAGGRDAFLLRTRVP